MLESITDVHEFFSQTDSQVYECEPGAVAWPAEIETGATWTTRCSNESNAETATWTIVGTDAVSVGGATVDPVRMREETEQAGNTNGSGLGEWWLDLETGLVLRQVVRNDNSTATPIGTVNYEEEYELVLVSLDPRR